MRRGVPAVLALLAAVAACGGEPPATVADLVVGAGQARRLDPAEADGLRRRAVLGHALVGGAAAHALAPPPLGSDADMLAVDGTRRPIEVARARLERTTQRTLATRQLLDIWAREQVTEAKNEPEAVRQAQRLLAALGYYKGPVTGVNGPLSGAAIRQFQAVRGLPETGDVTTSLLVALRAAL